MERVDLQVCCRVISDQVGRTKTKRVDEQMHWLSGI